MISRAQQILLKRAQREAGLSDADYRDALETVAGCRTSKDARLADRDLDKLLAYFEAIHWRAADAGTLQPSCRLDAVFRQRGYWASKNTRQETSRDRYNGRNQGASIRDLEAGLATLGFGPAYCATIRDKVCQGRTDAAALHLYEAALRRTLKAKNKSEVQRLANEMGIIVGPDAPEVSAAEMQDLKDWMYPPSVDGTAGESKNPF
jgi:hypothetical protein